MKNILMMLMGLVMMTGCSVVGPGEKGVRVTFGAVSDDVKDSGVYVWVPFITNVKKVNVQIQKSEIESSAASKDMQEITAHVAVNWALNSTQVVNTYKTIGDEEDVLDRVINPAVNEVMKASAAKLTAEEVLTKRMQMKQDIDEGLKQRLSQYGITLQDVSIVNLRFSKDFSAAIERKQIAEQEAQQAVYVSQKATQEAKAQIERAKGEAASQTLVRQTLTPQILQQRAIEKWNGILPVYMMGGQSVPFIHLNGDK